MRIGIDGRGCRESLDGIGRYTRNLVTSVVEADQENEYIIFVLPNVDWSFISQHSHARTFEFPHRHLSLSTINKLGPIVDQEGIDLFHSLFFVAPKKMRAKMILTVHDLMALTYPGFFGQRSVLGEVFAFLYHRIYVPQSIHQADAIIAVSDYTRQQIRQHLNVPADKISVIYNMVDSCFTTRCDPVQDRAVLDKYHLEPGYLLYVGNTKPYKNVEGLFRGYARYQIKCETPPVPLILIGKRDRFREKVERIAQDLKIAGHIRFVEEVTDQELPALMRGALALAQPSHVEGFGLPALESLACGTPVVASQASALSEVLGQSALTFPSDDNPKLGDRLIQLLQDVELREKLRSEGIQRAENFRKEAITKQILQLYRKVAKSKS